MIALKSIVLCGLALAAVVLAADRPPFKAADVEPPLLEPELNSGEGVFTPYQEVDEAYRLPRTSVPVEYFVTLRTEIHSGDKNFEGSVEINLRVLEVTNAIVIHHRGLSIQSASIAPKDTPDDVQEPAISYDATYEHLTFTTETELNVGEYILKVAFLGRLATIEDGFYYSSYVNDAGATVFLATTQFESTSARTAFPCYDEPNLKADFTIWITHHESYTARSNMGFTEEQLVNNYKVTKFDKTPTMSTYLLAFVISDFEFRGSDLHRVYARGNAIEEVEFALEAGTKILDALNNHIGINYYDYMPEMKQFAIPDFAAGAMENWGLITYREQYLLFNPALSTYRTKVNIATIIAHEFAHQWFGNLVSPEWWEFIWLNEGFATLYEFYAAHMAYPEEQYWELFNPQVIQAAMVPDGLETTRPMTWNAATPSEIMRLFDRVAYPKSGSVLNMMRHVIGEENWRTGIKNYLESRRLQGANGEHLNAGLQTAIEGQNVLPEGVTIKQVMDTWTTEKGYPVLSVRRTYETGVVMLSQERFISDRKVPNENVWMIPYNFVRQSAANFEDVHSYSWLFKKASRLDTDISANEWIIFNRQQVGYYRVNYDTQNWKLITDSLLTAHETIHRLNRAQLIDDAYWLARSGRLDFEIMFNLFVYLKNEVDYVPWAAASNVLTYYNGKLRGTPAYSDFMKLVDSLIKKAYSELTIDSVSDSETLLHKYLKQTISTWACIIGNADCLKRTKDALTNEAVNGEMVYPDIASVVYCYGLRNAEGTEYKYLYDRIYKSQNWAFRTMLIDALGCSENKDFLKAFLETAIAGNGAGVEINYKSGERTRIVQSIYSGGRAGVDALIEFLMDQNAVNEFVSRLGVNTLTSAISNIASRTNTAEELEKLNSLLSSLGTQITDQTANAARATVQANFDWHQSFEGILVKDFIEEYVGSIDEETTTAGPTTTTGAGDTTTGAGDTTTGAGDTTTGAPGTSTTEEPGAASSVAVSVSLLVSTVAFILFR